MGKHTRMRLFGKVMVPIEVHRQIWNLRLTYPEIAKTLGIALCTVDEFAHPGGSVKQATLDRVMARLAELEQKKESA